MCYSRCLVSPKKTSLPVPSFPHTQPYRPHSHTRPQVRTQPADGSEYHDLETARREVSRLRQQLMGLGDCSAPYFALRWSPWGTMLVIIHGFLMAILDLLEVSETRRGVEGKGVGGAGGERGEGREGGEGGGADRGR